MDMATLVFLGVLTLIVLADLLPWSVRRRAHRPPARRPAPPAHAPAPTDDQEPAAEEAALATMLLSGLIRPTGYQQRMAALAAREAVSHPWSCHPPDPQL
jgi:hypothetical protein